METRQTAARMTEQQKNTTANNLQLTPEQLLALAKAVLRLMSSELRGELERQGQENDRRGIGR